MQFDNISIIKKANTYFDGKVTSRTILFADGTKKTLGIMMPGQYTFDTDAAEEMEILGGEMHVKLPGSDTFETFKEGQTFSVPANATFDLKINVLSDYCCTYLP